MSGYRVMIECQNPGCGVQYEKTVPEDMRYESTDTTCPNCEKVTVIEIELEAYVTSAELKGSH